MTHFGLPQSGTVTPLEETLGIDNKLVSENFICYCIDLDKEGTKYLL